MVAEGKEVANVYTHTYTLMGHVKAMQELTEGVPCIQAWPIWTIG